MRHARVIKTVVLLAMLARLLAAPFTEDPWDMQVWRETGVRVLALESPYAISELPYAYPPPFALFCAASTALAGPKQPRAWRFWLKLPQVLADGVMALAFLGLGSAGAAAALVVALGPPFFLVSAFWGQFDALIACATILALLALRREKYVVAGLGFGLATSWKLLFPALALPWLVACVWRAGGRRQALRFVAAFFAVVAILVAPALLFDAAGFLRVISFQAERGPQGMTLWPLVARFAPSLAHAGDYLVPVALLLGNAWLIFARRRAARLAPWEPAAGVALLAALFLASSKVVNEQYALWLLAPLLVMASLGPCGARLIGLVVGMTSVYLGLHVAPDLLGVIPGWWRGEVFPLYDVLFVLGAIAWVGHLVVVYGLFRSFRRA